jgi:hypothetical protein
MSGGLSYVMAAEAEDVLHRDFVTLENLEPEEESWLRRVLEEHVMQTGSPKASRILSRRSALPLRRVQPVHFQGTVAATWSPVLAFLKSGAPLVPAAPILHTDQTALLA